MAINLRLVTSDAEIRRHIFAEIQKKESSLLSAGKAAVRDFIRDSIDDMMQTEQIRLIINDESIRGQIGVRDIGVQLKRFLRMFLKHIEPEIKWYSSRMSFDMNFVMNPNVYDDMFQDPAASFGSGKNFHDIEWLNWLLLAGNKKVVFGYSFLFYKQMITDERTGLPKRGKVKSIQEKSRTGYGIMSKNKKGWKEPSQVSGTSTNNIFTRILDAFIVRLDKFLAARMEQKFGE